MDPFSKAQRSYVMARVKSKDTSPELLVRKKLHSIGLRYKLHDSELPGKPDLVFPKYQAVIFIHGCFWHGHDCGRTNLPKTNSEYWRKKIERNKKNDGNHIRKLRSSDWRIMVVWECAVQGKRKIGMQDLAGKIYKWLIGSGKRKTIKGRKR